MEFLRDIWEWVVAVFEHWHGYVSGGLVAFILEYGEKLWDWKPPKRLIWIIRGTGLLFSMFSAWREKREEVRELARKLQESTQPKFEITATTSIVGSAGITFGNKTEMHTGFFIPVTVYNRGAPSVIRNFRLKAKLKDGRTFDGTIFLPSQPEMVFSELQQRFPTSQALFIKGTKSPIVTGGQCDGFVYFLFPPGLVNEMMDSGTVLTLEIEDLTKTKYVIELKNTGPRPTRMSVPPSMMPGN